MTAKKQADNGTTSFEDLFEQLETHAQKLESGDLPLQAALGEYEQAVQVAGRLKDMLRNAELRIEELSEVLLEDRADIEDVEGEFEDYIEDDDDIEDEDGL
jgi:exodeoxyribonuclease VII small subunit